MAELSFDQSSAEGILCVLRLNGPRYTLGTVVLCFSIPSELVTISQKVCDGVYNERCLECIGKKENGKAQGSSRV